MSSDTVDKKLQVIIEKYKDKHFARNAQVEVEDIRRKANTIGAATTAVAFVANEAIRLTMRSRKLLIF
jgi:hypothetical protein